MKKILILSASPQRDAVVDTLIADKLKAMGNEVWVRACLREGREAVLQVEPDIVVVPPIRNVYSRDLVEQLKKWNIGVVSRHTEPSLEWADFKAMTPQERFEILGRHAYEIDAELVWSEDEVQILSRRPYGKFPIIAVGAFMADIYKSPELDNFPSREIFNQKHKLSMDKKTVLLSSAWGFIDSSPDLSIDGQRECYNDREGRNNWLAMAKLVHKRLSKKWNILATLHPSLGIEAYKEALKDTRIEIDTESTAVELLKNVDVLVHAGSTMAVEMHFLDKPSFQFGDVNNLTGANWWQKPGSAISKVSPHYTDPQKLINAIRRTPEGSNASKETLKVLEEGRYGRMDGRATERAAKVINQIEGQFKLCWPDNVRNYDQLTIVADTSRIVRPMLCGICKKPFGMVDQKWIEKFAQFLGTKEPPKMNMDKLCPNCGARYFEKGNE